MPRPIQTLSGLIEFECAARHQSFRLAAFELNKTPAAISAQVKNLERMLGIQLFVRHPRHVALTDKGDELSRAAGRLLGELRAKILSLQAQDEASVLTVSTTHSFAMKWLVPRLHLFTDVQPDLDVRVQSSDEVIALDDGRCDVALRYGEIKDPSDPDLVYREALLVVYSPDLDPSDRWQVQPPELPELLRFPLLCEGSPKIWRDYLAANGLGNAKPKFGRSYSHGGILVQAAVAGLGVALAPFALAFDDIVRGRLIAAPWAPVPSRYGYRFLFDRSRKDAGKIQAFSAWMAEEASGLTDALLMITSGVPTALGALKEIEAGVAPARSTD